MCHLKVTAVVQLILHQKHLYRTEAVFWGCSVEKVFLEISQNLQENTCARVFLLIKLQALDWNFIKKETLKQVFSCEFRKVSKNTFFYGTPPVASSDCTSTKEYGSDDGDDNKSDEEDVNSNDKMKKSWCSRNWKICTYCKNNWNAL